MEPSTENNLIVTAQLLQAQGYKTTSRYLSRLCVAGFGPPSRISEGGHERLIEWQAAWEWAAREYSNGRQRRHYHRKPVEPDPARDRWRDRLIADCRIMALRDNDPETWSRLMQLPRAERLTALNRHNFPKTRQHPETDSGRETDSTDALINIPVEFDPPRMTGT